MTNDMWMVLRDNLRKRVGKENYAHWIEPLTLLAVEDGVARFSVPTAFVGDWVKRNYADHIQRELARGGAQVERLDFVPSPARTIGATTVIADIRPAARAAGGKTAEARARAAPLPDDLLPGAALDPRLTFDTFVVGKPNAFAHAAARRVAEGGPTGFNPLFLHGAVGLGKTHLMHAVAHELTRRQPDLRVLYLSAEQFMYRFIRALREREIIVFKEMFRSVDVLMVDDLQFIAGKDSTQEEFFHTFNVLVEQRKPIIISADRAPGEIKDLEERIRSRLQFGLVVDIHPTDYELRLGILQTKSEVYLADHPNITFAPGVMEFLAHRITVHARALEGALNRLFAFASLVGRDVTLDMVQECLADTLRAADRKITVDEIQRKVAEHYSVRFSDLIGPKRLRTIARPRQVAMYLSKTLTHRSLPEIGRRFGGRDHTTIMHGIKRIEELMATDSQLSDDVQMLKRLFQG